MSKADEIIIIGATALGKLILHSLLAAKKPVLGFLDDNPSLYGSFINGYPILGTTEILSTLSSPRTVLAIEDNQYRKIVAEKLTMCDWQSVIHPTAYVDQSAKLDTGVIIFAGSIVQPDSQLGQHVILGAHAAIDHDCKLANYVQLATGARLAGGVSIDEGAYLGLQSGVLPNLSIGKWSVIDAGSIVTRNVLEKVWVKGIPAKTFA